MIRPQNRPSTPPIQCVGECGIQDKEPIDVRSRQIVEHNKEQTKGVVEELGLESAKLWKTIIVISPHKKEQEGELAITREEMHSWSEPIKGDITYEC